MCQATSDASGGAVSREDRALHPGVGADAIIRLGVEGLIALHRLDAQNWDDKFGVPTKRSEFHRNTADTLSALLAENTRLREAHGQSLEALEPFAELGVWMFASKRPDDAPVFTFSRLNASDGVLTRGHFKAAHLAAQGLRDLLPSAPTSSEEERSDDTGMPLADTPA